jgi:hypothetical protein
MSRILWNKAHMDGLTTDIQRCPDGVELVDGAFYRGRTDRSEPERITLTNLEDPVVVAFVNATDDARRKLFFGRFGFLNATRGWHDRLAKYFIYNPGVGTGPLTYQDDILEDQSRFRELLQQAGGDDPTAAMTKINRALETFDDFKLRATFPLAGPDGTPRLVLKSESLIGFMLMETAMVATQGARLAECEHCGTLFLTGPMTGRRSHARFCSNKCRVAAMRARNAEAKMGE